MPHSGSFNSTRFGSFRSMVVPMSDSSIYACTHFSIFNRLVFPRLFCKELNKKKSSVDSINFGTKERRQKTDAHRTHEHTTRKKKLFRLKQTSLFFVHVFTQKQKKKIQKKSLFIRSHFVFRCVCFASICLCIPHTLNHFISFYRFSMSCPKQGDFVLKNQTLCFRIVQQMKCFVDFCPNRMRRASENKMKLLKERSEENKKNWNR